MNYKERPELHIVAGPTASGKTRFALELADKRNGELVNADSRQVYKYMDIGTNKGKVTGAMFNVVTPDQEFSLSEYLEQVQTVIAGIYARGKQPIIVGGSGLYIDALIHGYKITVPPDAKLRAELATLSAGEMYERLVRLAPDVANSLNESDRHNPRRLVRSLEKVNQWAESGDQISLPYTMYYPVFEREALLASIDARVLTMMSEGLVDEVKDLIARGYEQTKPMQGMGYLEIMRYLKGEISLSQAIELIQQKHRQYARRQITWFEGQGRGYNLTRVNFQQT
jgi:tRNA dimethylallyltransferase